MMTEAVSASGTIRGSNALCWCFFKDLGVLYRMCGRVYDAVVFEEIYDGFRGSQFAFC